ncbi:MAG: YqcI/YcgG family protein [Bacteroidota bacterium]|nr:YqcI/YcgG family protein [Bacteroidota bacterium]
MINIQQQDIIDEFLAFIHDKTYPCIGAKAAATKQQIQCLVIDHMASSKDDPHILQFLYQFVEDIRNSDEIFQSAAIIFKEPDILTEEIFEELLWQRLQSLADFDAQNYSYDPRVNKDPTSAFFSFSLMEEAFFIIGLHPSSSRISRQFNYPTLVFNPHVQFEKLRASHRYEPMKEIVRSRDLTFSGSINPMLDDFGNTSEVYQYSGKKYDASWKCPLKIDHATNKHNSTP